MIECWKWCPVTMTIALYILYCRLNKFNSCFASPFFWYLCIKLTVKSSCDVDIFFQHQLWWKQMQRSHLSSLQSCAFWLSFLFSGGPADPLVHSAILLSDQKRVFLCLYVFRFFFLIFFYIFPFKLYILLC